MRIGVLLLVLTSAACSTNATTDARRFQLRGGRLAELLDKCCACPRQALPQRLGTDPARHSRVVGRQALVTDE